MEKNREKAASRSQSRWSGNGKESTSAPSLLSHTCTLEVTVICVHGCVFFFQPGVNNVLDMGLEKPSSFSSRVTMVSDTTAIITLIINVRRDSPFFSFLFSSLFFSFKVSESIFPSSF